MDAGAWTYFLGYGAGVLSTLSPCVVPLLPILVVSAVAEHRLGLWALAVGLALSFALVGVFVATLGFAIGIDADLVRRGAGILLVVFGAAMALPVVQRRFAHLTSRFAGAGNATLARTGDSGWLGQLGVGALLGIVWTPCVGPTLGAATTLLAQGRQVGEVALLMLVFGFGAATPLLVVGTFARSVGGRSSARWVGAAENARRVVGVSLVVVGALMALGLDKPIETWLVERSPDWLTRLTTSY